MYPSLIPASVYCIDRGLHLFSSTGSGTEPAVYCHGRRWGRSSRWWIPHTPRPLLREHRLAPSGRIDRSSFRAAGPAEAPTHADAVSLAPHALGGNPGASATAHASCAANGLGAAPERESAQQVPPTAHFFTPHNAQVQPTTAYTPVFPPPSPTLLPASALPVPAVAAPMLSGLQWQAGVCRATVDTAMVRRWVRQ